VSVPGQAADRLSDRDPETTVELLEVLGDLFVWRLAPERWDHVGQLLDEITTALATMDVDAVRGATTELELTSPVRVHRIGATELIRVPEHVKDRANHLVHQLRTGEAPPTSVDQPDLDGGEGGDRHDQ
jgi:hypothetical protein